MYAVQFETDAKGRLIEIPKEYGQLASKHLKVIVMIDDGSELSDEVVQKKTGDHVKAMSLHTMAYKFDREQANTR